jgi:hypothetical protein
MLRAPWLAFKKIFLNLNWILFELNVAALARDLRHSVFDCEVIFYEKFGNTQSHWRARYLMGDNLKVGWAKFSTIS